MARKKQKGYWLKWDFAARVVKALQITNDHGIKYSKNVMRYMQRQVMASCATLYKAVSKNEPYMQLPA